ncbi:MAG: SH3 domain-containing protein [Clostridia bacterium]|nr:SH3 domain-containing protein [Clostridia bacterium]
MKNKKRLIKTFTLGIVLLSSFQLSTSFAEVGKSTASTVRIRKAPSVDSEVINVLDVDEKVEILGKEGDWYKVSFEGTTGYVSQLYIAVSDNASTNNSTTTNNEVNENNAEEKNANVPVEQNNEHDNNQNVNQANNQNQEENKTTDNVLNTTSVSANKVYKVVDDAQINILPTITAETIGEVKKNEKVTLINKAGLWVYVKSNDINGWMRVEKLATEVVSNNNESNEITNVENEDVKVAEQESVNASEEDTKVSVEENNAVATQNYEPKTMYVSSPAVNVRSESNTDSDIVDSLGLNTQVRVVGESNGWYKVEANGKAGYVRNDLLSDEKTEVASRTNNVNRNSTTQNSTVEVTVSGSTEEATTYVESSNESSVPVSSSGVSGYDVAEYAKQFLGYSYVYGAAGPNSFDCSGFTMYVYQHFGYSLSHSSKVQATQGVPVSGELQPGDILVFSNDGVSVGHVGLYLGNDKFIHASTSTTGVIISNLHDSWNISKYWGARRIL